MAILPASGTGNGVGAATATGDWPEATAGADVMKACARDSATNAANTLTAIGGHTVRRESDRLGEGRDDMIV